MAAGDELWRTRTAENADFLLMRSKVCNGNATKCNLFNVAMLKYCVEEKYIVHKSFEVAWRNINEKKLSGESVFYRSYQTDS